MKTEEELRSWLEANYPNGGWTLEGNYGLIWHDDAPEFRPGLEYVVSKLDEAPAADA